MIITIITPWPLFFPAIWHAPVVEEDTARPTQFSLCKTSLNPA